MFEDISEAPQREGVRGFVRRHFGQPADLEDACEELRSVSRIFSAIGLLGAVLGAVRFGPVGMVDGGVTAILALVLRLTLSRVAAGLLLLFAILTLALLPSFWHLVWLLFAFRGLQLVLAAFRLKKERAALPADPELPPGNDSRNPYRLARSESERDA